MHWPTEFSIHGFACGLGWWVKSWNAHRILVSTISVFGQARFRILAFKSRIFSLSQLPLFGSTGELGFFDKNPYVSEVHGSGSCSPLYFYSLGGPILKCIQVFFRKDQFEWPPLYVFCWVGIFWSETLCTLVGAGCIACIKLKHSRPKR